MASPALARLKVFLPFLFWMSLHVAACATTSVQDASACKHGGLNTATGLFQEDGANFPWGGVVNETLSVDFVCPLVRTQEPGPQGMSVSLYGPFHEVFCVLYSNSYQGAAIGSTGALLDPSGQTTLTLPQSQVPPWSAQSLYCTFQSTFYRYPVSFIRVDL